MAREEIRRCPGAIAIPPQNRIPYARWSSPRLQKAIRILPISSRPATAPRRFPRRGAWARPSEISGKNARVSGVGGDYGRGSDHFAMENSGTSTNLFASVAALGSRRRRFDGDESLRSRPFRPLLAALKGLGATFGFERQVSDLPFWVCGPMRGGKTTVNGFSSQFVSSLLFSCPCAPGRHRSLLLKTCMSGRMWK